MIRIILTIFFFFIFANPVLAAITINNFPQQIEVGKEFNIDVSLTNISGSHYLGIAVHKEQGKEYFGLTKNNEFWVEMEDENCSKLPFITVTESSWSGQLTGKITYGEKGFDGSLGNYTIKIAKYTESACSGNKSKTYSDEKTFTLIDPNPPTPTPSPTPTPTPSPSPSPTPTPTPKSTSTPRPTPSPTKSPTSQSTPSPSPTGKILATGISLVLGGETATIDGTISGQTTEEPEEPEATPAASKNFLPKILAGLAVLAILAMTVSAFLIEKRKKEV